jgi:adenylate cyclase
MQSFFRRATKGFALALAVLLLLTIVRKEALSRDVEALAYDFTVDQVGLSGPSPDIIIIDFDEETFQRINVYPVPRTYFADAINRISAGKPKVIGLDLYLDEPRTPAEDKALQDALTASGVVVLASQERQATLPPVRPLPQFCQPEEPEASTSFCLEGKPGALAYAFADMPFDPDGFIRKANLFVSDPPSISFPVMLAQQFSGQSIALKDARHAIFAGQKIPYSDPELQIFLIGVWGREPATRIPAWKLLSGQVPAQTFTGKLVMIGQTNTAARDTDFTPLYRMADKNDVRLSLGGTAIHAAAIRSILEGRAVQVVPTPAYLFVLITVFTAGATLLLACDLSLGVGLIFVIMALVLGVSLLLFAKLRFWVPFLPIEEGLLLCMPLTLGTRFIEERLLSREAHAQREQMMNLFSSYVDPKVAETIWKRRSEVFLGGEEHFATVMFTDIRGFTALSHGKPPEIVLGWLNRYVAAMDEVIRAHGGFLNKFIGDGLMIIFGLPLGEGVKVDARHAVEAAVAMLQRVELLNLERDAHPEYPHIRIGIGIHTGRLVAGSIGSPNRQEYSVIGETVNLASRLESLNKQFQTEILMTTVTKDLVMDHFDSIESLGLAKVAGLQLPVEVFTLRVHAAIDQQLTEAGAAR